MKYAAVFPGQGSQRPGMGKDVFDSSEAARHVFEIVSDTLDRDVAKLCFETDEDTLRSTDNAQIALYAASVATYEALREGGAPAPAAVAGHSVGEYAALAAAGCLTVADGAKLVAKRGDFMARSGTLRKGGMAAILGMDDAALEAVCAEISREGHAVVPANFNSPGQIVISGDEAAVLEACEKAKAAGAKRCIPLNVSGAFHSPLMHEAAQSMAEALANSTFSESPIPVVANVSAQPEHDWARLLEEQLRAPVRWTASVKTIRELGIDTFVECGPGDVLTGLLRRIDGEANGMTTTDVKATAEVLKG
ncbi:MAG: ACP S-malonyltransferase [Fimbriimonadales bacterium]